MEYKVILKRSALKDLDSLPKREVEKISHHLLQLQENPRPIGVQKLTDAEGYRIRSGNYRILFEVDDKQREIHVFRIKHRKEAYE